MQQDEQTALAVGMQSEGDPGDEAQRKLVILGIPWETESETLRSYFSRFCPVQDAVVMRDRFSGKSRGFGFVTFYNASDAQRVAAAEHVVDGRRCDAKLALPRSTTNSSSSNSGPSKSSRIFVARVPQTITDVQFKAYWEDFGPVQDAYMPKDVSKAGHRGIGFVTFNGSDALERVMATTHSLHGTELAVDRAEPKASERHPNSLWFASRNAQPGAMPNFAAQALLQQLGGASAGSFSGLHDHREDTSAAQAGALGGYQVDHHGVNKPLSTLSEAEKSALEQYSIAAGAGMDPQRLQLAQNLIAQHQASFGRNAGANSRNVQALQGLSFGPSGQGIGIGLSMLNQAGANGRGALDTSDPTTWQMMQAVRNAGLQDAHGVGAARPSASPAGGLNASARAAGPRIFVGKLNKDCTEGDVKDYFSKFGYVLDVYMPRDKANRSEHRGFGFVTFETQGALTRIMTYDQPHQIRGSIIAIDDAAPRREDGLAPGGSSPSHPGSYPGAPPAGPTGSYPAAHPAGPTGSYPGPSAGAGSFVRNAGPAASPVHGQDASHAAAAAVAASGGYSHGSSHAMQSMEALEGAGAVGDESLGPARRHAAENGIRNGYKPY